MKTPRDVEAEALSWLVRRDAESLTAAEEGRFSQWYHADVRHEIAYLRVERVWEAADGLRNFRGDHRENKSSIFAPRWRGVTPRIAAAAATIATLTVVLLAWALWGAVSPKTYGTGRGEFERVVLADETTVDLNADSEIRVKMTDERREVRLLRGEAHFRVVHDAHRPFDVHARGTVVRAIGTAFSVRLIDAKRVDVLVSEGLVAVRPQELQLDLDTVAMPQLPKAVPRVAAGQVAIVDSADVVVEPLPPERIARRLAWIEGWVDMTDKTLAQVAAEFNRFNERQMVVDPKIATRRLGGRFKLTDPESFIATLVRGGDIRAEARQTAPNEPVVVQLYARESSALPR